MKFSNVIARYEAISLLTSLCVISVLFFSCGSDVSEQLDEKLLADSVTTGVVIPKGEVKIVEPVVDEEVVVLEKNGIILTEIKAENNPEATIVLNTKQFEQGENHLSFSVKGVKGYSIAYLANNFALSQFTSDVFNVELMYGNNVFLAFLTDKDGISIKTNKGSVLKNAVLGGVEPLFGMKQPHLFYYMPQSKTEEAILDFYLVNTAISENGNKVKVTINETEFLLNKWAAYKIEGLKNPENTVRIQLLDKDGVLIDGPFNDSGERFFSS